MQGLIVRLQELSASAFLFLDTDWRQLYKSKDNALYRAETDIANTLRAFFLCLTDWLTHSHVDFPYIEMHYLLDKSMSLYIIGSLQTQPHAQMER